MNEVTLDNWEFLRQNNFTLGNVTRFTSFDNYLAELISPYFYLRYSQDRSFRSLDISNLLDKDNWYDLALVKALLSGETILNRKHLINELNEYLEKNFDSIKKAFDEKNYANTKIKLNNLERERAKQMFPRKIK